MNRKNSVISDNYVLIGDNAIEVYIISRIGILKENGILDYGSLSDVNASEDDRVLNSSLNNASVCNVGVLYLRALCVNGRSRVTELGVYRVLLDKQTVADLGLKELHRASEIAFERGDLQIDTVVLIAIYSCGLNSASYDVLIEVAVAVSACVVYCVEQEETVCDHNICADVSGTILLDISRHLGSIAVLVALDLGRAVAGDILLLAYRSRNDGDIRVLLGGERTALNYLQRMSGIATYTRNVANLLEGTKTRLLDTRKTSPNNRIFEKYAVRVGGGNNHRYNLSDGVLLKDNHIGAAGSVKRAIEMAKEYAPFVRKIEVEVETIDMVREAVEAGADIIMLDNMTHEQMEEAIRIIDGRAEIEVSGNVTKENIARLTDLGVDCISSGALTHSAPIMDISLKNLHAIEA